MQQQEFNLMCLCQMAQFFRFGILGEEAVSNLSLSSFITEGKPSAVHC